jgi:methylmalonyl-CoA mutase
VTASSAQLAAPGRAPERVRVVTAAALFDGHDASINIMRRILQAQGAEVIHLGHDRSVEQIAEAAVQEDAHAVALSSYQGGHMEFFRYLVDLLRERGAGGIRIFGGGGGTITAEEAEALHAHGVTRIFGPEDGRRLGLDGMIRELLEACSRPPVERVSDEVARLSPDEPLAVARLVTWFEDAGGGAPVEALRGELAARRVRPPAPVVGFTGTGGSGKSSVVDELVRRFRLEFPEQSVGLLLVDPTRRRSGGALLGDRIRMNAIYGRGVFARSMATREPNRSLPRAVADAIRVLQAADFDLVLVETAGIGQGDSAIVDLVDRSVYVMTPEYGAPSQLEKIDMLDLADLVVLNKFDRQAAQDALRDVRKQWRRNRERFELADEEVPVFPTVARQWNDAGMDRLFAALCREIPLGEGGSGRIGAEAGSGAAEALIPPGRSRYLAEIAESVRGWRARTEVLAERAADACAVARALRDLGEGGREGLEPYSEADLAEGGDPAVVALRRRFNQALGELGDEERSQLAAWHDTKASYSAEVQSYQVRGREVRVETRSETLAHTQLPKVALPRTRDWGELVRYFRLENLPGRFPFTAGVFPFRRQGEDPTRMFAGEGGPERTNRRFHYLCSGQPAARLSTAFDSVTLYGRDPDEPPDIYGKVGNSGVSVCSVDDAKKLYSGFDLCDPSTSVSMTINGPAPAVLAFFLNAAIDQGVEKFLRETGRLEGMREELAGRDLPVYSGELPQGHDGFGLALLGISGAEVVPPDTYARIRDEVLGQVRGTVQADILKEDQAQNTCLFSTEFALKLMGDVQEYFIQNRVRNCLGLRLPHGRGGRESDHPAGLHPRQRLHPLRVLRGARPEDRRLRAQLLLLLQQRPRGRVQRDRPRGAAHLGGGHAGALRRFRAQPEAQVPHADLGAFAALPGDGLQRHPHHAPGADGPAGQLQQPSHQRLRRGRDHAQRGVRAPRPGDPAHHQPRARDREERESAPGLLRGGRAHRRRGGGTAAGVRTALGARRGAGCDGNPVPAGQDPGREPPLREAQGLGRAPHHRRQHLREP